MSEQYTVDHIKDHYLAMIDEIDRLREDNKRFHKQAEMNARLLTENAELREALIDAAGELQHAYIMGFTERYRDAAHAARRAVGAMGDKNE